MMSLYGSGALGIQAKALSQQYTVPKIDANVENKELGEQTDAFESVILK